LHFLKERPKSVIAQSHFFKEESKSMIAQLHFLKEQMRKNVQKKCKFFNTHIAQQAGLDNHPF